MHAYCELLAGMGRCKFGAYPSEGYARVPSKNNFDLFDLVVDCNLRIVLLSGGRGFVLQTDANDAMYRN